VRSASTATAQPLVLANGRREPAGRECSRHGGNCAPAATIVINQTEALVSIDVQTPARSTREHHIEDTALKTNLEASEEVARQLRLRDLAGLIVIDFIDMDEKPQQTGAGRAQAQPIACGRIAPGIQVGRISHFGLLEMSRQRIRASVAGKLDRALRAVRRQRSRSLGNRRWRYNCCAASKKS